MFRSLLIPFDLCRRTLYFVLGCGIGPWCTAHCFVAGIRLRYILRYYRLEVRLGKNRVSKVTFAVPQSHKVGVTANLE